MEELFIGLGFMKCGTTFLTNQLACHPDLYLPPIRELRYWDSYFMGRALPVQKRYAQNYLKVAQQLLKEGRDISDLVNKLNYWNIYAHIVPDGLPGYKTLFEKRYGYKAYGEISPSYVSLTQENMNQIALLLPNAKVFLTMREPFRRLVSQYRHTMRLRPHQVSNNMEVIEWLGTNDVNAQVYYGELIRKARNAFGTKRVKILFFEDMIEDQVTFFDELLEFIGVPFRQEVLGEERAGRASAPEQSLTESVYAAFREKVKDVPREVEQLIGRIPEAWKSR